MATPTAPRLALGRPALAFAFLGMFALLSAAAIRWWTFTRPTGPVRYVAVESIDRFETTQTPGGPLLLIAFLSIGFAIVLLLAKLVHQLVVAPPQDGGRAS
jgi:hypothetical protein